MPEDTKVSMHGVMGRLGVKRVLTGYTTVMIMLSQDEGERRAAQQGKWRNMLRKAEKSGLNCQIEYGAGEHLPWLLSKELEQQSLRGYIGFPPELVMRFVRLCASPDQVMAIYAYDNEGPEPVAGMLFLSHGVGGTYHAGWTSPRGREKAAHNLMLWETQKYFYERGREFIDLGGVNTEENPGLARFKLGTGGRIHRLLGTYL